MPVSPMPKPPAKPEKARALLERLSSSRAFSRHFFEDLFCVASSGVDHSCHFPSWMRRAEADNRPSREEYINQGLQEETTKEMTV